MTKPDLDHDLTAWLNERAPTRAPERLLGATVYRTARTRPRRAWRILERWTPMTIALRPAALPRGLLFALVTLGLLVALAAATLYAGSRPNLLPAVVPPAGPGANGLIAFLHQDDIHVAAPDGSDRRPLVEAPGLQAAPSWSPDGTRLAYWSSDAGSAGPWQLMVVGADGSNPIAVATDVLEITGWQVPAWSPDGSQLAFSSRTVGIGEEPCLGASAVLGDFCSSRIFLAASDGSTGAQQVGDPNMDARTAAWSPGGSTISFSGGHAGTGIGLYLMATDGADVRRLDQVSGTGWTFIRQDWSPDGASIVATAGDERWDVWVFAADGGGERRVSVVAEGVTDQFFPAYAPDGTLAWIGDLPSSDGPVTGLVLLEDGGVPIVLEGLGPPVWAPDGRLIATGRDAAPGDVVITDRDGAVKTTIDAAPRGEFGTAPSWQRVAP
jgi:WD40-like Beta Propeller Repeat